MFFEQELLADFEANFDRALLSVGRHQQQQQHQQAGGEDTAPPLESKEAAVDTLLLQEVAESKQRMEKLETLNATLQNRSAQLELELSEKARECNEFKTKITHLQLEKRMAVMEAENASKELQRKVAELEEMQMELDMVTKASVRASAKAAVGEEMRKKEKQSDNTFSSWKPKYKHCRNGPWLRRKPKHWHKSVSAFWNSNCVPCINSGRLDRRMRKNKNGSCLPIKGLL